MNPETQNKVGRGLVYVLRCIVFYPMMVLRGILQWALRIVGGICILLGVILFIAAANDSISWSPGIAFLILGGAAQLLAVVYDKILLRLNPTGQDLVLFR